VTAVGAGQNISKMSLNINWSKLDDNSAQEMKTAIQDFLDKTSLPDFLTKLNIIDLKWGTVVPELEIIDISDVTLVTEEVHKDNQSEYSEFSEISQPPKTREFDFQVILKLKYSSGDSRLSLNSELSLNYPTFNFLSLPFSVSITNFTLDSFVLVAFVGSRVHVSLLSTDHVADMPLSKPHLDMKMDWEVGDPDVQGLLGCFVNA
jgi:mitochondrial distribution and morphology protein 12